MKRHRALAAVLLLVVACGTASHTTYVTIGSTKVAVDLAMKTWGNYVVAAHPPPAQEDQVRAAYGKVQTAAKTAAVVLEVSDTNPTPQALSDAAAALVSLVETITGKKLTP
jgi:hypothetical protein